MGSVRDLWCWGKLSNSELLKLHELRVNREPGQMAAYDYLQRRGEAILKVRTPIIVPILIMLGTLIAVVITGIVLNGG